MAPHHPLEAKRPLWQAEDLEQQQSREYVERFAAAEREYELALSIDPASVDARAGLADLYLQRATEAAEAGDAPGQAYYLERLRLYDDGSRAARLQRPASLTIECEPAGAEARLAPLVERDRRLVPGEWQALGSTPVDGWEIPEGRYTLEIAAEGRATARYAIRLEPGEVLELSPRLPREGDVPDGFAYVPAGPAWIGGDPLSPGAGPRRKVDLPDFAIGIFPVTMAQYVGFLDDLPREQALEHVPRDPVDDIQLFERSEGGWTIPSADAHGDPLERDMPVFLVRASDAIAYVTWQSKRDGREYRLPERDEWEYAARSCDGRLFPWGDGEEPTYAWGRESHQNKSRPVAVGRCPEDCSPTGIRDLAGGVGDWLADDFSSDGRQRHLGGGSWFASRHFMRLPRRFGLAANQRSAGLGFRLLLVL